MTQGRPLARVLIALLLVVQVALPATAVLADGPPPPSSHAAHLSTRGDPGCEQVHHDLHCLLCRVVSGQALGGQAPSAAAAGPELALPRVDLSRPAAGASTFSTCHARAPPVSWKNIA